MTLDPDGCTFWYTSEYYAVDGLNHQTRIGSFKFAECTQVGNGGTVSGTVTAASGGAQLSGATIQFGARSTTTDGSGFYSFLNIPAGTYPSITASFPGYNTGTASNIVVTDGGITTVDFALSTAATSACLTDTTQADFQTGVATNVDLTTSPGDVTLSNAPTLDQSNTAGTTTGTSFSATSWGGQTFIPALTGTVVKADVQLFCSGCTGTTPNLTASIRATSAGLPTGADLATATIPGFSNGAGVFYTASFGSPAALTAGTQYALIVRPVANPSIGGYFWIRSSPGTYANGQRVTTADSGSTWTADVTRDFNFNTYMFTGYRASGNLVSSVKDSNPLAGLTPIWTTLSWNGSTPANTTLRFQIAASNSNVGPFNFVGPDGTASTFFTTSPASLNQFYGLRYLQYKAYLDTSDSAVTPTLNDVTVCYNNTDCGGPISIMPTPAQVCANSTGNTASGPAGETSYSWSITNGTITSATNTQSVTYTAGASGSVGLQLDIVEPGGCHKTASTNVTINPIPATPTITPGGPTTFCAGGSVTLTSSSATGNQWYLNGNPIGGATNQSYVATASGDYTVRVTSLGCTGAASSITTVTVNPIPATPTITPGGPTTFCTGGSVTLTSSSASGNQWYLNGNPIGGATNQTYVAAASGNYTVVVTTTGCSSAPSAATTVTVNPIPATPTITPGGPTSFCPSQSVTLTSSSATGNQWYLNGNPIGGATNQTYVATASGSYTVKVTALGCTSAPSAGVTVTVSDSTPPTITCPANQMVTVASAPTAVTYPAPTVSDNCPGVGTPSCTPPSGSLFPAGVTTVNCNVSDFSSQTMSCQFTVTVIIPCTITCPANITKGNDPNQCGAVATFAPTTTGGGCGTVTCTPASGSFFPKGTTSVSCSTTAGPSCGFTVTVNDTQAPVFPVTCPAVAVAAQSSCPVATSKAVTFATPAATDNCAGVVVACVPPSGGTFPVGTTSVTCTATDTSNNTAQCSFPVTVFSLCVQDDTNPGNVVLVNVNTGAYRFCCNGVLVASSTTATVSARGCVITITDTTNNRNVQISVDGSASKGSASIRVGSTTLCSITDRLLTNNTCVCQ